MTGNRLAALLRRRAVGDDEKIVVQMLVERAQSRLDAQLHGFHWLDLKALGLLGADAAAVGVLIGVHDAVGFWWLDATGLAVAGLLLLAVVWPRSVDAGPNLRVFYETFGGEAAIDV